MRIGNDTVPPMWGATLRVVLAALVLVAIERLRRRPWPSGPALRAAVGYGFFQFGINIPLLYWGETVVSSGMAAVVYATVPITGAIIARLFGLERLALLKMAGALVALGGVAVLFGHQLGASVTALPLLAIWLATVSAALGSTLLKRGPRQDAIGANAVANIVAAPMCLLASFLLGESRTLPVTWTQIYPILYLALAGSVVAFVVFSWLVIRLDVSTVA
ncbi:MAG TPA: EamA family transporter, partial [Candidatus Eisenbacteria bacterium]|nr:EamA family transporter [Candidatus Eisenbacteria bacterium]